MNKFNIKKVQLVLNDNKKQLLGTNQIKISKSFENIQKYN